MRALFALAALLGTTVATLAGTLSAQEFNQWQVWLQVQQVGPEWDALRHAELLATASNGGQYRHRAGRPFNAGDYLRPDPWAEPQSLTPEQERERLEREFAQMQQQHEGPA